MFGASGPLHRSQNSTLVSAFRRVPPRAPARCCRAQQSISLALRQTKGGGKRRLAFISAVANKPDQKHCAKHGTDQIEVVAGTVGQQVELFGDMGEDND